MARSSAPAPPRAWPAARRTERSRTDLHTPSRSTHSRHAGKNLNSHPTARAVRSSRHTERLAEIGAVTYVASRAGSYGNAAAESLIGLSNTELIRRCGPGRGLSRAVCPVLSTMSLEDLKSREEQGVCLPRGR